MQFIISICKIYNLLILERGDKINPKEVILSIKKCLNIFSDKLVNK